MGDVGLDVREDGDGFLGVEFPRWHRPPRKKMRKKDFNFTRPMSMRCWYYPKSNEALPVGEGRRHKTRP